MYGQLGMEPAPPMTTNHTGMSGGPAERIGANDVVNEAARAKPRHRLAIIA
jgi:hypothetical protein